VQDRNARERPGRARGNALVRGAGGGEAACLVQRDDRVQARVVTPDSIEEVPCQLDRGERSGGKLSGSFGNAKLEHAGFSG
jgi:hypothetical protein